MSPQNQRKAYAGLPAENYERYFVPAIGEPLAVDLVDRAALTAGERVLDVACGTGVVARSAFRNVGAGGAVAGLDINPGMLAVADAAAPPGTTIEWHESSAEAMPLLDESFDAALCQMGLQFMQDPSATVSEMHRVLAPGGRLAINLVGPAPEMFADLAGALACHAGPEAAGFVNRVFSLHDKAEIQTLIEDAGFREVTVAAGSWSLPLPAPEEFLWQYVFSTPLAAIAGQVAGESLDSLERDVVSAWQAYANEHGMTLEVRVVTATGRK